MISQAGVTAIENLVPGRVQRRSGGDPLRTERSSGRSLLLWTRNVVGLQHVSSATAAFHRWV